jgi:hypothetical protein
MPEQERSRTSTSLQIRPRGEEAATPSVGGTNSVGMNASPSHRISNSGTLV